MEAKKFKFEAQKGAMVSATVLLVFAVMKLGLAGGVKAAGLLFLSLIGHEVGHALVASCNGTPVSAMGVCMRGAYIRRRRAEDSLDEMFIALAGPFVSVLLGLAALPFGPVGAWVAMMNFTLVASNLLPLKGTDGWRAFECMKLLVQQAAISREPSAATIE